MAPSLVYAENELRGAGFELLLDHVRDGGIRTGLWRTVLRLLKLGEPARAARLAAALTTS